MKAILAGYDVGLPERHDPTPDLSEKQLALIEKHKKEVESKIKHQKEQRGGR